MALLITSYQLQIITHMRFEIITLFPEVIETYVTTSILGRAQEKELVSFGIHDLREYGEGKHKTVDDGGAGMVLKIEPIAKALSALEKIENRNEEIRTVVLSARGKQFTQEMAKEYAQLDQLVLICGRYEGIDQRVADHLADEEISIGPYVLAGGEIAALAIIEATARLIPGVLGNPESLVEESHTVSPPDKGGVRGSPVVDQTPSDSPLSQPSHEAMAGTTGGGMTTEYPQYTKPEVHNGWPVPEVLLSGDHAAIKSWRDAQRDGSVN